MAKITFKQHDITDCGATCLASIASHYHLQIPIARIRQYAGTDKKGTNVLGLIEAAEKLGFEAKGVRGELDSLFKIPLPAIAHIIVKEKTGSPQKIATLMKISERSVHSLLDQLKDYNATIVYSRRRETYFYENNFKLEVIISVSVLTDDEVTHIFGGSYFFQKKWFVAS